VSQKTEVIITARDDTRAAIASAQRGLQSLSASAAGLKNSFSFLGSVGGLAGLLGGATLASTVKTSIDSLDALNESAERLGVTVEDLSALNFAGKLNGVAADEMAEALKKLSVKMKDAADGGKEASKLFEALGVSVTDSSGRLKSADAVFAEVADSFAGMEDGAGKTAIAVETFGKSGAKLVPILNGGAAGLKSMREEGEKLGAIIDGKLAKQADEFNDNLDRLKTVSAAAGIAIASDLLPWLTKLSEEFLVGIKNADGFGNALLAYGTLNPFKNTAENLAVVRGEISKMEADLKDYGYLDEQRYNRKKTQLEYLKGLQINEALANSAGNYGNEGRGATQSTIKRAAPSLADPEKPAKVARGGGSARAQADDAARLLESLREKIALNDVDLASTDKLTNAEKEAAKVRYLLEAGTLKASAAQREAIFANLDNLAAQEKSLAAQEEYRRALENQESINLKNNQAMLAQIAAAEEAAEVYGLNAAQISVVEQARLADAIAIAEQNGASEEQLAFMREELALRAKLSDALIKGETRAMEKRDAEEALAAVSELDEFTKSAAKNMQSAFADFLFDPFAEGIDQMGYKFAQTVQRMAAEALAANLMKKLLGDYATGGKSGDDGLIGGLFKSAGSFDWASLFNFADGGIMTAGGPLPLRKYASGGVASSPQLALFGEGATPEAYVPLPDGRRIPVSMSGGGATQPQNIRIVNAFDQSVIGDYLGSAAGERVIMNAVQRNASAFKQALA